jgi:hypothetical protein
MSEKMVKDETGFLTSAELELLEDQGYDVETQASFEVTAGLSIKGYLKGVQAGLKKWLSKKDLPAEEKKDAQVILKTVEKALGDNK